MIYRGSFEFQPIKKMCVEKIVLKVP